MSDIAGFYASQLHHSVHAHFDRTCKAGQDHTNSHRDNFDTVDLCSPVCDDADVSNQNRCSETALMVGHDTVVGLEMSSLGKSASSSCYSISLSRDNLVSIVKDVVET